MPNRSSPTTLLIVGSVAWDEVIHLTGPLTAGSHNQGRRIETRIGVGAANTAMALTAMAPFRAETNPAVEAMVDSAVGPDTEGKRLRNMLHKLSVRIEHIDVQGQQTTRSLVLLEKDGERTVINLARAEVQLPPNLADMTADCCYVRSADPALTPILAKRVQHSPVLAHIPPITAGSRPAQVLVGSASDLDKDFLDNPFSAGKHIAGDVLEWVVVTFGAAGAIAYGDGASFRESAPKVKAKDTTGAGDAFAAGLAFSLALREEMPIALKTAVRWGSTSVQYHGTVPPSDLSMLDLA